MSQKSKEALETRFPNEKTRYLRHRKMLLETKKRVINRCNTNPPIRQLILDNLLTDEW